MSRDSTPRGRDPVVEPRCPGMAWPRPATRRDTGSVRDAGRTDRSRRGGGAPRVRDLPPPRENPSVTAPALRWLFAWPYRAALAGLYRLRLRPWQLTVSSLVVASIVGGLFFTGRHLVPGFLLLLSGLLDIFDGGLARVRGEESRIGALLDSVVDRASDAVVLGSLFVSLAIQGQVVLAGLCLASLVVSLLVSDVRAQAEAAGVRVQEGLFQRAERVVVLVIGLTVPGALGPALLLLAVMGTLTAAQRVVAAWRRLPPPSRPSGEGATDGRRGDGGPSPPAGALE